MSVYKNWSKVDKQKTFFLSEVPNFSAKDKLVRNLITVLNWSQNEKGQLEKGIEAF